MSKENLRGYVIGFDNDSSDCAIDEADINIQLYPNDGAPSWSITISNIYLNENYANMVGLNAESVSTNSVSYDAPYGTSLRSAYSRVIDILIARIDRIGSISQDAGTNRISIQNTKIDMQEVFRVKLEQQVAAYLVRAGVLDRPTMLGM